MKNRVFLVGVMVSAGFGALSGIFYAERAQAKKPPQILNVKRINVLEEDGSYALVIANSDNLPGSLRQGKQKGMRQGVPGILFYNPLGDEVGGLIYPGSKTEAGYDGGVQLSMDQINQTGQAIALRTWRSDDSVRSVLEITDYATDKFAGDADQDGQIRAVMERMRRAAPQEQQRIFQEEYLPLLGQKGYLAHRIRLGTEGAKKRAAKLEIMDSRSRPRIRLMVDENDVPRIEILDARGKVVRSILE